MGLMPSHAAGDSPVFALKEIVVAPGNSASGLDPHQGAVLLHDGVTGQLIAILNASPITEIRTAAVSGARDEAARAAGLAHRRRARLRRAGTLARRRDADGARRSDHPDLEPQRRRTPRRSRSRRTRSSPASVEEALDGADIVCTATSASEPLVELEWLAPGHARQRRRGVPGRASRASSARATVAASRFFVDRRESTLNEAGDYRVAAAESGFGPEHIVGELGELLNGTVEGRRSDDELTVFKSMGIAVEDLAAGAALRRPGARARRRRRGRLLIPLAEIEAARERIADVALRTPLIRLQVPESPAEIWLKLECLQPIGSFKIRGAANAIRSRTARAPSTAAC